MTEEHQSESQGEAESKSESKSSLYRSFYRMALPAVRSTGAIATLNRSCHHSDRLHRVQLDQGRSRSLYSAGVAFSPASLDTSSSAFACY